MKSNKSILLVEDDPNFGRILKDYLTINNYEVTLAVNGIEGFEKFNRSEFDLCILDIMMPFKDGLTLAREIREINEIIPLIFLTAKNLKDDVLKGYKIGADDYLTKPFFFAELNARIKSLIRRLNVEESKKIVINELSIYPEEMKVLVHDKVADLTSKEFSLLLYFASNQNRVLSKTILGEFMSSGYDDYGFSDDLVYTHIKNLKKKLSKLGCTEYIKNVYGIGYKFITN